MLTPALGQDLTRQVFIFKGPDSIPFLLGVRMLFSLSLAGRWPGSNPGPSLAESAHLPCLPPVHFLPHAYLESKGD